MDSDRFDAVVRALATSGSRRRVLGGLLAAAAAGWRPGRLAAQDEIATAGNGGTADASANGGAVATGNVNSGANAGNAIGVGDTAGGVAVDGGSAANMTSLEVSAEGGNAIADASGGDVNETALIDDPKVEVIPSPPEDPAVIPPEDPPAIAPAPPPEPPLPTCMPQDEVCTRSGMACCAGSECITDDSARGICLAVCGEGTTRCNELCVGFCELNVPHAGGCEDCVCRSGQLNCTLGTEYPLSDLCCLPDQECCRVGPIGDPSTVQTCCPPGTCVPGVGCA